MGEVGATLDSTALVRRAVENAPRQSALATTFTRQSQGVKKAQQTSRQKEKVGIETGKGRRVRFNSTSAHSDVLQPRQHFALEEGHVQLNCIHHGRSCSVR